MISPINFTQTTDFWIFSRSTVDEVMLSPFFFVPLPFPRGLAARQGRQGAPWCTISAGNSRAHPMGSARPRHDQCSESVHPGTIWDGQPSCAALGRAPLDITVDHLYSDSTVDNTAPKI